MGKQHGWNNGGKWLTQNEVADIKKLISTAESDFGVRLYGDLANSKGDINSHGEQVVVGVGSPTIHSARIAFSAPGQEDVAISFADTEYNYVNTQGNQEFAQKADMLTGAIMLYLAEKGKIRDYEPDGISLDTSGYAQIVTVDGDIHDSYNFVENVLGRGTLDDLDSIAFRKESMYVDPDSPHNTEIQDGYIPLRDAEKFNKIPLGGRSGLSGNGGSAAQCGSWMPRAHEYCALVIAHSGSHRSK